MWNSLRQWVVLGVATVLVGGMLASTSQAAPPMRRAPVFVDQHINRNYMIAPGLSIQQYAFNVRTLGRAYSQVPPYALGYNPYVTSVYTTPYMSPYYSAYTPFLYNPYLYSPYGGYYP
jgi:hypothetical protein